MGGRVIKPEDLARLVAITEAINAFVDGGAMKLSLSGEFYFTLDDAAGNRVVLDVEDGSLVVTGVV